MDILNIHWHSMLQITQLPQNGVFLFYGSSEFVSQHDLSPYLSSDELTLAQQMVGSQRKTWIATKGMLRYVCSQILSVPPQSFSFKKTSKGKPYLSESTLRFSISHSESSFLIAMSMDADVGVDLEISGNKPMVDVAKYAFSAAECDYCANGQDLDRFYAVWTLKEAFLKSIGMGLIDNLWKIDVMSRIKENGWIALTVRTPGGEIASLVVAASIANFEAYTIPLNFNF